MPPLGRRHSSSSQTVCASSVRLSVEQSRVICRIRSNSSGFNSRPQNDRPPPMVTGMMWSLLVAGPHAYLTEISRKCPEKSLPIPRYRSGLHSVLQLANLQAQALACDRIRAPLQSCLQAASSRLVKYLLFHLDSLVSEKPNDAT